MSEIILELKKVIEKVDKEMRDQEVRYRSLKNDYLELERKLRVIHESIKGLDKKE